MLKSLDLSHFNVAEMDYEEMQSIDGGIIPLLLIGALLLLSGCALSHEVSEQGHPRNGNGTSTPADSTGGN